MTGQIRLTAAFKTNIGLTGGTIEVDDLNGTFLTDISLTDTESGITATYAKDGYFSGSSETTYTLGQKALSSTGQTHLFTDDLVVEIMNPEKPAPITAVLGIDLNVIGNYTDSNFIDAVPGDRTSVITGSMTVSWTKNFIRYRVTALLTFDNTVEPQAEEITITVAAGMLSSTFGPYTFSEFTDVFGATVSRF